MTDKLSATMAIVLVETRDHGGKLVRHAGGFWSYPSASRGWNGLPDWHCGTSTVEALATRGELEYTEWRDGRNGRFPIAARIPAESAMTPDAPQRVAG